MFPSVQDYFAYILEFESSNSAGTLIDGLFLE